MKIIDTSKAVDPNKQQPFSTRSLYFLQRAFQENYKYIASAIVGTSYDENTPYVIDGCVLSNADKDITNGHIFYKGLVYTVHGMTGSTGTPIRFLETLTPDATADPTMFSDGTIENVHIDHDYDALDSATVTYDFSATDLVYFNNQSNLTLLNSWTAYNPGTPLTPKYKRVGGTVFLQGAAFKYPDNSGVLFTVPAPSVTRHGVCILLDGANYTANLWTVQTNGNFTITVPSVSGTSVIAWLDGICYDL